MTIVRHATVAGRIIGNSRFRLPDCRQNYGHFTTGGSEDRIDFDIAAGAQAENGAAVVEQVELDIAAAAHELLLALGLGPGRGKVPPHQLGIDALGMRGRHPG